MGSEEEQIRKREAQDKKNWIVPQAFKCSFGRAVTNDPRSFIRNYVTADPSQSPLMHKFRDESKEQWMGENFKF